MLQAAGRADERQPDSERRRSDWLPLEPAEAERRELSRELGAGGLELEAWEAWEEEQT